LAATNPTRREVLKAAAAALAAWAVGGQSIADTTQPSDFTWVYIGGYSDIGIRLFKLNLGSAELEDRGVAAQIARSSFFTIAPNGKFLYSCLTILGKNSQKLFRIGAFAIDARSGKLSQLNDQPTAGDNPCYIAIDSSGRNALVANYDSATVASLPIDSAGRLGMPISIQHQSGSGPDAQRQAHSYPHSINLDPANKFAYAPDLGADRIFVYRFDQDRGTLTPSDPPTVTIPPGSGPRHMAFNPNGKIVYLINELGNTLIVFTCDPATGSLTEIQSISTLPAGYTDHAQAAEVQLHPSGKFLFCSNRGPNNIATFSIDPNTGRLAPIAAHSTLGNWPRFCRIDPTGNYLIAANQRSDTIVLFRIATDGSLELIGTPIPIPQPSCVEFLSIS
jgi:6-phosphogluconolactonase